MNARLLAALVASGASTNSLPSAWREALIAAGAADGQLSTFLKSQGYSGSVKDMFFKYLGDRGYVGSLTDRLQAAVRAQDIFGVRVDLFLVAGQSNAKGRGDSAQSPSVQYGLYIADDGTISALADPVGDADTGSAWPAFANEWYAQTGRIAAFCTAAVSTTPLTPDAAGQNWSPSGDLRSAAAAVLSTAVQSIKSSGAYVLNSARVLWIQGERDSKLFDGVTITGPIYEAALEELAQYFQTEVPEVQEMGVFKTGAYTDTDYVPQNWADIRTAQEEACTDSSLLTMLYRGAYSFSARGYLWDVVHWNQTALNIAGKCAARALATGTAAIPTAPIFSAVEESTDSTTTVKTTRTESHTTTAGTDFVVVVVGAVRGSASTTFTTSMTFGGVPMTQVVTSIDGNTTTACRANTTMFYIDEAMYGASLANVTADVVCTTSLSVTVMDMAIIDCAGEGIFEDTGAGSLASSDNGTNSPTYLTTTAPTFVIAACASSSAGASPLTATWNNGTERVDHGLSTGSRTGNFTVTTEALAAEYVEREYTATWSGTCNACATVSAAFRGKISGE